MSRTISPTTIKKEIATLRTAWNWALNSGILTSPFPKKLRYPKSEERHPFQTWDEIERRIAASKLSENEQKALWDCLYLNLDEIRAVLSEIEKRSQYPFLHPMSATAAYTGARRSELCRAQAPDFDLENSVLTIRETKRTQGRRTMRQVPISNPLRAAIEPWLRSKPDSLYMFPADHRVSRNRRNRDDNGAVSVDEATYHLDATLEGTKWSVIRGWHVFRHSFCSNCASAGIDQRMIDAWMGHQTDEMRKRYRHLFPDAQQAVLNQLFATP